MKTTLKACAALTVCAALFSAASSDAQVQTAPKPKPVRQEVDIFANAKPGQWVQLKGRPQPDQTYTATKVKFLSGDMLEDKWEVKGKILTIDKQKQEMQVVRQWPVKCQAKTDFEDIYGNVMTINKLAVGKPIEVEGTFLADGTFLAKEIKEDEGETGKDADDITLVGRIDKVNPTTKTIEMMGVTFRVTDKTKSKAEFN